MKTPYHFFLAHAGYSYDAQKETPMQGRIRCAKQLAAEEKRAKDADVSFEWDYDGLTSKEWTDEEPAWSTWSCVARNADGEVFASLCGIDFGRDGKPWGDPYRRVVEAELACRLPDADE